MFVTSEAASRAGSAISATRLLALALSLRGSLRLTRP
jgi:hypothetical protein